MKKLFLFLILIPLFNTSFSQEYFFGGALDDFGRDIEQTLDNNFIITGFTNSLGAGGSDYYLAKVDLQGSVIWEKAYGGSGNEFGRDVIATPDGGYALLGYSGSFGAGIENVYLVRTDANGDTLWTKTYGGTVRNHGFAMDINTDGGFIITGYTNSTGAGSDDVYLIRTDLNGDTLWTKTYGANRVDRGYAVRQTNSGGFIVAGYTNSFSPNPANPNYDIYLLNVDANGDTLWTKRWGGINNDRGYAVQQTTDNGFIVVGYANSFGAGQSDVYIIKTDSLGNTLWTKTYGGSTYDYGYAVRQLSDGGYIISGETESFGNANFQPDMYALRLDNLGDTLWTRTFGGIGWDYGRAVANTPNGGFALMGVAQNLGLGLSDAYLVTIDSLGNPNVLTTVGNFENLNNDFVVYPNPANDVITIQYSEQPKTSNRILITNQLGQIVKEFQTKSISTKIKLGDLPSGIYFIKLEFNNNLITKKLIITH